MEETKPKREDARIRSTKGRVQEIFLQHLREKPASRISVTQICKEAGINRTTFYKHYLDVFDLLDKTERELQTSFREAVGRIQVTGVVQTLTEILQILQQNMARYWPLFGPNGDPALAGRLIGSCYPLFADNPMFADSREYDDDLKKILYCYVSGGCMAMLTYWVQYGQKRSSEEMAVIMDELIRITMAGVREHLEVFRQGTK